MGRAECRGALLNVEGQMGKPIVKTPRESFALDIPGGHGVQTSKTNEPSYELFLLFCNIVKHTHT